MSGFDDSSRRGGPSSGVGAHGAGTEGQGAAIGAGNRAGAARHAPSEPTEVLRATFLTSFNQDGPDEGPGAHEDVEFGPQQVRVGAKAHYLQEFRYRRTSLGDKDGLEGLRGAHFEVSWKKEPQGSQQSPQGSCAGFTSQNEVLQNFNPAGFQLRFRAASPSQAQPVLRFVAEQFNISVQQSEPIAVLGDLHWYFSLHQAGLEPLLREFVAAQCRFAPHSISEFQLIVRDAQLVVKWVSSPAEVVLKAEPGVKKEIALLSPAASAASTPVGDPSSFHVQLAGIATTIGADTVYQPPKKVLFFPALKNRLLPAPQHAPQIHGRAAPPHAPHYNVSLASTGLHPTLAIDVPPLHTDNDTCKLFLLNHLPSCLFFDKYQYNAQQFKLLRNFGSNDLEAPQWHSPQASVQFLQLLNHSIEIPLHARYVAPVSGEDLGQPEECALATPLVFYACDVDPELHIDDANPFIDTQLDYHALFTSNVQFVHVSPDPGSDLSCGAAVHIPALSQHHLGIVNVSTLCCLMFAVVYLLAKLAKRAAPKLKTS